MNNELYHYGVKGMKWGVRRYQNKDGSLTPAGKKHYDNDVSDSDRYSKAKKLADRDFDATRKDNAIWEEYEKEISEYDKKHRPKQNEWLDGNGKYTKKALAYMDKTEEIYQRFEDKRADLWKERQVEEKNLRKSTFLTEDLKPDIKKAKELRKELDSLQDEMVGYKSKAYKDAFEKYKKTLDDVADADYGFDHYHWPYSQERKQAMEEYEKVSSTKRKEYTDLITDIGNKAVGHYKDQKMDDGWYDTYGEWGKTEVDEIIRFNRIEI